MHPFLSSGSELNFALELLQAEAAEKRNKACPGLRPDRSREEEIMQHQMSVLQCEKEETTLRKNKLQTKLRSTWVTGQCHCSMNPIDALQPIQLREMMVPKIHTDRYLICRTLGKIVVKVGATALVEDLNGDVEIVSLYNFRYDLTDINWLLPGSIMVVKEPYFKYASNGVKALIRVDSPSDVEFVEEVDYKRLEYFGALKW